MVPALLIVSTICYIIPKIKAFNSVYLKVRRQAMTIHMMLCIIMITVSVGYLIPAVFTVRANSSDSTVSICRRLVSVVAFNIIVLFAETLLIVLFAFMSVSFSKPKSEYFRQFHDQEIHIADASLGAQTP